MEMHLTVIIYIIYIIHNVYSCNIYYVDLKNKKITHNIFDTPL